MIPQNLGTTKLVKSAKEVTTGSESVRVGGMHLALILWLLMLLLAAPGMSDAQERLPGRTSFQFVGEFGEKGNGPGRFRDPAGIAIDPLGHLYVADRGNDRIQKFGADGEYSSETGSFGWEPGQFNQPEGVAVGKGGLEVYVADGRNNRIQILSPHFQLLAVVGGRDARGPIELGALGGVAVSADGEIYVSDLDLDKVVQISTYSRMDHSFGGYGYGSGRLRRPLGIGVGDKGRVYVCDSENDRIAVFDRFGGNKTPLGEGSLAGPAGVCLGPRNTLVVADTGHHRVLLFDLGSGDVIGFVGGPDPGGDPGEFNQPRDVCMGPKDVLFVLDSGNHRVQKFRISVGRR